MTAEDTQEIILVALFRLKVLLLKQSDPILSQELEHIFQGLKEGLPTGVFADLWQTQRTVKLLNLPKNSN